MSPFSCLGVGATRARYVFCKAKFVENKIKLNLKNIEKIPEKDIVNYVKGSWAFCGILYVLLLIVRLV